MNRRTILKLVLPVAVIILWEALSISIQNQFILPNIQSVLKVLLSPGTDILGSGSLIDNALMIRVILPAAAPEIWTGMRIGFGIAWMCVVAAEMLPGTSTGLGYLIMYAYSWGQIQVVMAGMIAIGIIGIVVDRIFVAVEMRWFSWRGLER